MDEPVVRRWWWIRDSSGSVLVPVSDSVQALLSCVWLSKKHKKEEVRVDINQFILAVDLHI